MSLALVRGTRLRARSHPRHARPAQLSPRPRATARDPRYPRWPGPGANQKKGWKPPLGAPRRSERRSRMHPTLPRTWTSTVRPHPARSPRPRSSGTREGRGTAEKVESLGGPASVATDPWRRERQEREARAGARSARGSRRRRRRSIQGEGEIAEGRGGSSKPTPSGRAGPLLFRAPGARPGRCSSGRADHAKKNFKQKRKKRAWAGGRSARTESKLDNRTPPRTGGPCLAGRASDPARSTHQPARRSSRHGPDRPPLLSPGLLPPLFLRSFRHSLFFFLGRVRGYSPPAGPTRATPIFVEVLEG